jgi:circadian clock protein KaiB
MKKIHTSSKPSRKRPSQYALRLYVTGASPLSRRAVDNLKKICEKNFAGRYSLEIVDLYQQPGLTQKEQIVASPTLIKTRPLPTCRFVGDLSDSSQVVSRLKRH